MHGPHVRYDLRNVGAINGGARVEMEDEPGLFDLVVEDDGPQPIGVWSLIQRASKLDITRTQAQKMFKSGEHPVVGGLPEPQAEALKVEFEALGATVRLGPAGSAD
jgi:ribosomal protein L7/L12